MLLFSWAPRYQRGKHRDIIISMCLPACLLPKRKTNDNSENQKKNINTMNENMTTRKRQSKIADDHIAAKTIALLKIVKTSSSEIFHIAESSTSFIWISFLFRLSLCQMCFYDLHVVRYLNKSGTSILETYRLIDYTKKNIIAERHRGRCPLCKEAVDHKEIGKWLIGQWEVAYVIAVTALAVCLCKIRSIAPSNPMPITCSLNCLLQHHRDVLSYIS